MIRAFLPLALALSGCALWQRPAPPLNLPAGQPLVQVDVASLRASAVFSRIAANRGVETYSAATPVTVALDHGLLVATRGMGDDLMAADLSATKTALAGGGAPVYKRKMRYLTPENRSIYGYAACEMHAVGRETKAGRTLMRMEERCQMQGGAFTNIFWRDASGAIRASEQWASPAVGMIALTQIKD